MFLRFSRRLAFSTALRVALLFAASATFFGVPAFGTPVTFRFSGPVNNGGTGFLAQPGDTWTLLLTYDPALLPGVSAGAPYPTTTYATMPVSTAISFQFSDSAGDAFTSDSSLSHRILIRNTPPLSSMLPGAGEDSFFFEGFFSPTLRFRLNLVESLFGTNPLTSNALPTTAIGSGKGSDWYVSEFDIDRLDTFANMGGHTSLIELVPQTVPEPSTLVSSIIGIAALLVHFRHKASKLGVRMPKS